jgi:hypothetical protein
MDRVEALQRELERVGLVEAAAGVPRLRLTVYAENTEPGPLVAASGSPGAREEVK